jgi:hypothetical protein
MSTRIHIILPEDTLKELDSLRGAVPRSAWVRELIEGTVHLPQNSNGDLNGVAHLPVTTQVDLDDPTNTPKDGHIHRRVGKIGQKHCRQCKMPMP